MLKKLKDRNYCRIKKNVYDCMIMINNRLIDMIEKHVLLYYV